MTIQFFKPPTRWQIFWAKVRVILRRLLPWLILLLMWVIYSYVYKAVFFSGFSVANYA